MEKKTTILQINSGNFGSTGTIMLNLSEKIEDAGFQSYVAYPKSRSNAKKHVENSIQIGNRFGRNLHFKLAYYTGLNGCFSKISTHLFLKKVKHINPDIIHLHNLHNCYINLNQLFKYIKKNNVKVVWTLHDCWAFTGQCPHFAIAGCYKWKSGCYNCPQYKEYPSSLVDRTKLMYKKKKQWFTGVKDLHIITPSKWLAEKVRESYLNEYPFSVINNGIDLNIFKPTESDFRSKHNLEGKTVLLGVAHSWSRNKGLDIFVDLAGKLDDNYKIALAGLTKEQLAQLPENILAIDRNTTREELAKLYTMADFLLNSSRQETMGLVTVEALACGTPAIVSNFTAVPEMVSEKCGIVVKGDTWKEYYDVIVNCNKKFKKEDCIDHAKQFDKNVKYDEYISIYKNQV